MSILADLRTAIILAVSLALYFYFKPSLGLEVSFFFFGFWGLFFTLDAKITTSNPNLMNRELNLIFPILYIRFGPKISPIIQFVIECTAVVLIASLFEGKISFVSISVVSAVFGLAHLEAYFTNIKTVKKFLKR
jgi:hypothetical protein